MLEKREASYINSKEHILVYGMGDFYFQNENIVNHRYYVEAFIDRRNLEIEGDKKVIYPDEIKNYTYDKIIIMVQSIQECINISKKLISQDINYKCLILGHTFCGRYSQCIDNIEVLPDGNILMTVRNISVKIQSEDEFNNTFEVLVNQLYHYYLNNDKPDIVLDVGMNIGDATLYFLNQPNIKKIYGYEPFKQTYLAAKNNLKNYLYECEKVEIFQYGISNENAKRIIGFNNDMSCGQSTVENTRGNVYETYLSMGLVQPEREEQEEIEVRKASQVFWPIIQNYSDCNIILKMNCEGEEYGIIEELTETNILDKFTFIMLEWHYQGRKIITKQLEASGFSYWCYDKSEDIGLIYAYKMLN